jgi:DNA-binding XRE family transcriptional regulator
VGSVNDKSFFENFCAATKRARIAAGLTQNEMAEKLDIPRSSYQTYEDRSPLPLDLILRFCLLTNITVAELFDRANNPPRD